MAELIAFISALTRVGVTQDIKVEELFGQGFASVCDIENINTFSQLLLNLKPIRSGGLLQPGDIPFSITALVIIKAFWFWIKDLHKRNQYRTGGDFNQAYKD